MFDSYLLKLVQVTTKVSREVNFKVWTTESSSTFVVLRIISFVREVRGSTSARPSAPTLLIVRE